MSAPSLPPVLDAAQSSFHVFMTGPTASCGSNVWPLEGGEIVVQLLTTGYLQW